MLQSIKYMAAAAAISIAGVTGASAVTTMDFAPNELNAGDGTLGSTTAFIDESFDNEMLSFTALESLLADVSITVNPFLVSPSGIPSNSISISWMVDDGPSTDVFIEQVPVNGEGSVGAAGFDVLLAAGQTLSFTVNGDAGPSGNQVTFAAETTAVPVPAAGLLYLAGVGGFIALRRKRKAAQA